MPKTPPDVEQIMKEAADKKRLHMVFNASIDNTASRKYLHWDKVRHLKPHGDLTHEEWWGAIKLQRLPLLKPVPLRDKQDRPFQYAIPSSLTQRLHEIDLGAGGQIGMPDPITNPQMRDRYLVGSLIEEAITSSQLEGAATTREVAKEMIRNNRKPRDLSERMILNNYNTMHKIRAFKTQRLTPSLVLKLHEIVTLGTLGDPNDEGCLRSSAKRIDVAHPMTNEVFHAPPPVDELEERMIAMCDFANGKTPDEFLHPVIRAIILHFWLAYDHPFVDGNGRAARALFYWCMLHNGYWLCEFISISEIILKGPAKYGRAFLHTETDGNDLTYFLDYHLEIIRRAVLQLHDYVARKTVEVQDLDRELRVAQFLNHRQRALVAHAIRHPNHRYTIESHLNSHNVVYQTARTDLLDLAKRGVLDGKKVGKTWYFTPARDIEEVLRFGD